jgi:hypothetical protein
VNFAFAKKTGLTVYFEIFRIISSKGPFLKRIDQSALNKTAAPKYNAE